jgi:hypothetical protein
MTTIDGESTETSRLPGVSNTNIRIVDKERSAMDSDRFDAWTRRIAAVRSRRAVVGVLAAGVMIGTIADAAAQAGDLCAFKGAPCRNGSD